MTEIIKQTRSEKFLIGLLLVLILIIFYIFVILPNKCLFVKNYDPNRINFSKPENISILNVGCGNVIIELYPDISPIACLLYTSPSPRDRTRSRMPSSA